MNFDDKAAIVSECWMVVRRQDAWGELIEYGDLGFPLAYAYVTKAVTLEDQGRLYVEEVYDVILASLNIPDEEYVDFEALLDKHLELYPPEDEDKTES